MKLVLLSLALGVSSCGLSDKAAELEASATALETEYEGLNLSCSFDEVSGAEEAEAADEEAASLSSEECEDAEENYSSIVAEFDADADGALSDDELAEAEAGWQDAQVAEMDADSDGTVSDAEKASWKTNELPARKAKLDERFAKACDSLGKGTDDCRGMRGVRKDKFKEDMKAREAEFDVDKDGKLSETERKALGDALKAERHERRDDFKKEHDADGDGKMGPEERQKAGEKRGEKKEQAKPAAGPKPAAPAGGPKP